MGISRLLQFVGRRGPLHASSSASQAGCHTLKASLPGTDDGEFQAALQSSFDELFTFHFKDEKTEAQRCKWFYESALLQWTLAEQPRDLLQAGIQSTSGLQPYSQQPDSIDIPPG